MSRLSACVRLPLSACDRLPRWFPLLALLLVAWPSWCADAVRTRAEIATDLADNTLRQITAQKLRNAIYSLRHKNELEINALDYAGVDPTGATDSTAGLQAALDAAKTTHADLYIPKGTYSVTQAGGAGLDPVFTLTDATDITIRGDWGTTLLATASLDQSIFLLTNCQRIDFERLTIDSNWDTIDELNIHGNGVRAVKGSSELRFIDCTFKRVPNTALVIRGENVVSGGGNYMGGLTDLPNTRLIVTGCRFEAGKTALNTIGGGKQVIAAFNQLSSMKAGIKIDGQVDPTNTWTTPSGRAVILGNTFHKCGGGTASGNIEVEEFSEGVLISGNLFDETISPANCIKLTTGQTQKLTNHTVIADNIFAKPGTIACYFTATGLAMRGISISGNTFYDGPSGYVFFTVGAGGSFRDVSIVNNDFTDWALVDNSVATCPAVNIAASVANFVIDGNRWTRTTGTTYGNNGWAIYHADRTQINWLIRNNSFVGLAEGDKAFYFKKSAAVELWDNLFRYGAITLYSDYSRWVGNKFVATTMAVGTFESSVPIVYLERNTWTKGTQNYPISCGAANVTFLEDGNWFDPAYTDAGGTIYFSQAGTRRHRMTFESGSDTGAYGVGGTATNLHADIPALPAKAAPNEPHYDSTRGKWVMYNGSAWVDLLGAAL